jgi:hypothetical protein
MMLLSAALLVPSIMFGAPDTSGRKNLDSGVYLASMCTSATSKRLELDGGKLVLDSPHAGSPICVDNSKVLSFQANWLRIVPYANGTVAVKLKCSSTKSTIATGKGVEIALVAGRRPLGTFWASGPIGGPGCGHFPLAEFGEAVDLCESVAEAWGNNPSSCLKICKSESEDICVSHK